MEMVKGDCFLTGTVRVIVIITKALQAFCFFKVNVY